MNYTVHCRRPSGGYQQPFPGKSWTLDKIHVKYKDVNTSPVVNGQTTDLNHLFAAMNAKTVSRIRNVPIDQYRSTIHCDDFLKYCWEIHFNQFRLHQLFNLRTMKTLQLMKNPTEETFDCQTGMFQQIVAWKDAAILLLCSNAVFYVSKHFPLQIWLCVLPWVIPFNSIRHSVIGTVHFRFHIVNLHTSDVTQFISEFLK